MIPSTSILDLGSRESLIPRPGQRVILASLHLPSLKIGCFFQSCHLKLLNPESLCHCYCAAFTAFGGSFVRMTSVIGNAWVSVKFGTKQFQSFRYLTMLTFPGVFSGTIEVATAWVASVPSSMACSAAGEVGSSAHQASCLDAAAGHSTSARSPALKARAAAFEGLQPVLAAPTSPFFQSPNGGSQKERQGTTFAVRSVSGNTARRAPELAVSP